MTVPQRIIWLIKWTGSFAILGALSMRGIPGFLFLDMLLNSLGLLCWFIVGWYWRDRALIIINIVGVSFLVHNILRYLVGW